jgi:hypothetical protein
MRMILLACLMILSLRGQNAAEDSASILKQYDEAQKRNGERANRYTYVEDVDYFKYDKNGQARKDRSETNDVIFVEGESYKRLIARNGKPLDPREAAKEEKKMNQTAEQRRKERRSGSHEHTETLGSDDLRTLCDNRLVGEEELHGRKAWVIEYTPKKDHVPANQHEKDVFTTRTKVWIDQAENVELKSLMTVVGEGSIMKPGTTITMEFAKINDDAWLPASFIFDVRLQIPKLLKLTTGLKDAVRQETRYSNFRKFDVESTITSDDSAGDSTGTKH